MRSKPLLRLHSFLKSSSSGRRRKVDGTSAFKRQSVKALIHGHCHEKALIGSRFLKGAISLAYAVEEIDSGCCGMAGSFGFEKEHYDVSMAIGRRRLLPRR